MPQFRSIVMTLGAVTCAAGAAQEGIDPPANAVLRESCRFIGNLDAFEVDISSDFEMRFEGDVQTVSSAFRLSLDRPDVTAVAYVGREQLAGVLCHRIAMRQAEMDWQMLIQAEDAPVPRLIIADMGAMFEIPVNELDVAPPVAELVIRLDRWLGDHRIDDETFTFVAPVGAERVESLFDDGEDMAADPGPHPLLGETAPSFWLDTLGGGEAAIVDHRGKAVVIIDFWASWMRGCETSVPLVASIARDYHDRGVRLISISVDEDRADARALLDDIGLELPVALDRESRAASTYDVFDLPQVYLVGRDGTIQAVHYAGADMEARQLADALDAAGRLDELEALLRAQHEHGDREAARRSGLLSLTADLVAVLLELGRASEAESMARDLEATCIEDYGLDDHRTLRAQLQLATSLHAQGKAGEAAALDRRIAGFAAFLAAIERPVLTTDHAAYHMARGAYPQAEDVLLALQARFKAERAVPNNHVLRRLVTLYEAWGRPDEAGRCAALIIGENEFEPPGAEEATASP